MVVSWFTGRGVGFGFGVGCGFGIGWGFGGSSLQTLGIGAGGGCGVGLGLGWGFGGAYGTKYVDAKPRFEGIDFHEVKEKAKKDETSEKIQ
ncbi:hypothetical protein R1sor_018861 [Riccia sorocarpa]|uniref:Glycine zipper 2TM domain-containing protein n=1 Tax=Riccia sorocarpa TaxID=122646 RepID=A0ABD3ICL8_9MARC